MSVTPFSPAPFDTPIVSPSATTLDRRQPYISPSELKNAPTALALGNLVPGGSAGQQSSELYNVLLRASDWVDLICFHGADGTLAASPTIQSAWVTPKHGRLAFICNMKPILAVIGMALGSGPANLSDIGDSAAQNVSIDSPTIIALNGAVPMLGGGSLGSVWPGGGWRSYAVWSYIAGYPHMVLAAPTVVGAESITVAGSVPGQAEPYGVYPGTQLTIRDAAGGVEVCVVQSIAGDVLTLGSPLAFPHKVPAFPDFVYVTALPHAVEQATISLACCLIKLRGTRAAVMPSAGQAATKTALISSGGLEDYEVAVDLLKPFTTIHRAS